MTSESRELILSSTILFNSISVLIIVWSHARQRREIREDLANIVNMYQITGRKISSLKAGGVREANTSPSSNQ